MDVLGWKGIYNRETDPISKLANLVKDLSGAAVPYRGSTWAPEIRSISDTIVIVSTGVAPNDASQAIAAHGDISARAIAISITSRIPLRGATAFGEFEVRENIYVGKAIDEAASWYETGDWIGVHLTPSVYGGQPTAELGSVHSAAKGHRQIRYELRELDRCLETRRSRPGPEAAASVGLLRHGAHHA
jgi:hypothetical protein